MTTSVVRRSRWRLHPCDACIGSCTTQKENIPSSQNMVTQAAEYNNMSHTTCGTCSAHVCVCGVSCCLHACVHVPFCRLLPADIITGRRLLVADGQQIVYKKRVLLDRGDTFAFMLGTGAQTHHCVAMIRDIEMKFVYGEQQTEGLADRHAQLTSTATCHGCCMLHVLVTLTC